jgi:peptidoglycan/xylan/chitin deacetylase (PgdA/CDA1 family)
LPYTRSHPIQRSGRHRPRRGYAPFLVALTVLAVATGWWRLAVRPDRTRITRASVATPSPSAPVISPVPAGGALERQRIMLPRPSGADVTAAVQRFLAAGDPIRCGGGNQPVVAVTFEDGPGPYTERTLELLRKRDARATFFLNGTGLDAFAPAVPGIQRIGEVGNHGWSHQGLVGADEDLLTAEVDVLQARLAEITGVPPRLFRPPYGAHDEAVDDRATSLGLLTVLSTVDVNDDDGVGAAGVWSALERGVRPGAILVLRENEEVTRSLLPDLLALIEERGLYMATVPELLAIDPPSPEQLRDGTCPRGA